ncbi:FAD-dependent monooxygenase [Flavobacteriaceae bacterium F08102]|nr:FAD-dependent monooxygenase [Flavobacteriaceae bacterium F08102]
MNKILSYDVGIIGGGLAGLTSAIRLAKLKHSVVLIEKNSYPKHKVCGEYISKEVEPYLRQLGLDPFALGAVDISTVRLTTENGKTIDAPLGIGGFGLSRYTLDNALMELAKGHGVHIIHDTVSKVFKKDHGLKIITKSGQHYWLKVVQGAHGKRGKLDKWLKRPFIQKKAPFLAVKTHLTGSFPDHLVALYNFKGGYGGLSKVEGGAINFCYIVNYSIFKQYKDLALFEEKVILKNPALKLVLANTQPVFDQPLTISQINFSEKELSSSEVLMTGDAAGLIHPLCGNGMSMAIQSAQIFATLVDAYLSGRLSRHELERAYRTQWNEEFKSRLRMGRVLARVFTNPNTSNLAFTVLKYFPSLLRKIIRQTHGKPF